MRRSMMKSLFVVFIIILITTTACGSKAPVATQAVIPPTEVPRTPTQPPPPTETAIPTGLVTNLADLKSNHPNRSCRYVC